jgi:hypothetical protein
LDMGNIGFVLSRICIVEFYYANPWFYLCHIAFFPYIPIWYDEISRIVNFKTDIFSLYFKLKFKCDTKVYEYTLAELNYYV